MAGTSDWIHWQLQHPSLSARAANIASNNSITTTMPLINESYDSLPCTCQITCLPRTLCCSLPPPRRNARVNNNFTS